MITTSIYELMKATSGITTLCSDIYPAPRPLRIGPPFITYVLDDDRRERLLDGSESAYRQAIFSIDCYDSQLVDAIAIADAVESALIGYTGSMGTSSPVDVDHVRLERRGPHVFEEATDLHRVPLELLIGYEE